MNFVKFTTIVTLKDYYVAVNWLVEFCRVELGAITESFFLLTRPRPELREV